MRVAILWTGLSGYLNACLKELAGRPGIELFVSHQLPNNQAPFDEALFAWIPLRYAWRTEADIGQLYKDVEAFRPDVIILAGWHIPQYRKIARKFAGRCWRVMTMDNGWRGTLKQRLGAMISRFYVRPIADVVWLPGERQASFARRLGFNQSEILRGLYSCDQEDFAKRYYERINAGTPVSRSFLFAGRFVASKGVDTLVRAYQIYREHYPQPWPLICCGSGPLQSLMEKQQGICVKGFVQPAEMPSAFSQSGCFVLASTFEPWSLAVHEAASAGMIILASETVGASVHLVQPGYNGYIFAKADAEGLAQLMVRVSSLDDTRLDGMSQASNLLSLQYSPRRWADTIIESVSAFPPHAHAKCN